MQWASCIAPVYNGGKVADFVCVNNYVTLSVKQLTS